MMGNEILLFSNSGLVDVALIGVMISGSFLMLLYKKKRKQAILFSLLFFYHLLFIVVVYKQNTTGDGSDSINYYLWAINSTNWLEAYGFARKSVIFIVYPFTVIGASYFTVSLFFGILGFLGIYFSTKRLIEIYGHKLMLIIFIFLPTLHYWNSTISKEALVLFFLGFIINELFKGRPNWLIIIIAFLLSLHVRVYTGIFLSFSIVTAYLFLTKNVSSKNKIYIGVLGIVTLFFVVELFRTQLGLDTLEAINDRVTDNQQNWTEGGSTLNLANYNFLERIFIFLYFPVFPSSISMIMILLSIENAFLMLTSLWMIKYFFTKKFPRDAVFTFCSVYLLISVLVFSTVTANTGTAIRKKSTVIPVFIILFSGVVLSNRRYKKTAYRKPRYKN